MAGAISSANHDARLRRTGRNAVFIALSCVQEARHRAPCTTGIGMAAAYQLQPPKPMLPTLPVAPLVYSPPAMPDVLPPANPAV